MPERRVAPMLHDDVPTLFEVRRSTSCDEDIDVVDPAFCRAQKYPDAAGLQPREIFSIIRRATATKPMSGFDLCCFSPRYDEGGRGALPAARFALQAFYAPLRQSNG